MPTHLTAPAAAPEKPNVNVPLDTWPSILSPHADAMPKGTPGGNVLANGVAALGQIYGAYDDIDKAMRAAHAAMPPRIPAADVIARMRQAPQKNGYETQLDTAMLVRFQKLGPALDQSIAAMKRAHADIEKQIGKTFAEDARTREIAGDVRGHFGNHSKPEAERLGALLKVIGTGDEAEALMTARAMLRPTPSYLSGFSKANMALIRDAAARRFAPGLLDQHERGGKIIAHVENVQRSFVNKFAKMRAGLKPKNEREVDTALGRLAGVK
jgi:hypothetical protein